MADTNSDDGDDDDDDDDRYIVMLQHIFAYQLG